MMLFSRRNVPVYWNNIIFNDISLPLIISYLIKYYCLLGNVERHIDFYEETTLVSKRNGVTKKETAREHAFNYNCQSENANANACC